MKKNIKKENGITIISLLITIILLLILAGITLGGLSNSGVFDKTKSATNYAKEESIIQDIKAEAISWKASPKNNKKGTLTKERFAEILSWYGDVIYKDDDSTKDIIGIKTKKVQDAEKDKSKVVSTYLEKDIISDEFMMYD